MTAIQAHAFPSNWSQLPEELLLTVAEHIALTQAAQNSARVVPGSAGFPSLMPVCKNWMQFASAYSPRVALALRTLLPLVAAADASLESELQERASKICF